MVIVVVHAGFLAVPLPSKEASWISLHGTLVNSVFVGFLQAETIPQITTPSLFCYCPKLPHKKKKKRTPPPNGPALGLVMTFFCTRRRQQNSMSSKPGPSGGHSDAWKHSRPAVVLLRQKAPTVKLTWGTRGGRKVGLRWKRKWRQQQGSIAITRFPSKALPQNALQIFEKTC